MKSILAFLFLLFSTFTFSQRATNQGDIILIGNDTIAVVDYINCQSCNATKSEILSNVDTYSWMNKMDVGLSVVSDITVSDKQKISQLFNGNNITYNDSLGVVTDKSILEITPDSNEQTNIQLNIDLTSEYLIKSANQKMAAIIVGVVGGLGTSLMAMSGKVNRDAVVGFGFITAGGVVALQISSSYNLKMAGGSLKKVKLRL